MNWNKRLLDTSFISGITQKIASAKVSRDANNISEHFHKFLQPHIAVNQSLKEEVFKIRHKVYCEELALEEIRENGQETDEFDEQSIFSLIQHIPTKTFTSCVRLVTSHNNSELLPIEKFCMNSITDKTLSPNCFDRSEIAEISRLAVKPDFRRRKTDKFKGSETGVIDESSYSQAELRCFPFIAIGLYMAAATMGMNTGIRHVYVMMEPRLARSMKFIGITFKQLGSPVEYHGLRAPYYINADIFMQNLTPGFGTLYQNIEREVCLQLKQLN